MIACNPKRDGILNFKKRNKKLIIYWTKSLTITPHLGLITMFNKLSIFLITGIEHPVRIDLFPYSNDLLGNFAKHTLHYQAFYHIPCSFKMRFCLFLSFIALSNVCLILISFSLSDLTFTYLHELGIRKV